MRTRVAPRGVALKRGGALLAPADDRSIDADSRSSASRRPRRWMPHRCGNRRKLGGEGRDHANGVSPGGNGLCRARPVGPNLPRSRSRRRGLHLRARQRRRFRACSGRPPPSRHVANPAILRETATRRRSPARGHARVHANRHPILPGVPPSHGGQCRRDDRRRVRHRPARPRVYAGAWPIAVLLLHRRSAAAIGNGNH